VNVPRRAHKEKAVEAFTSAAYLFLVSKGGLAIFDTNYLILFTLKPAFHSVCVTVCGMIFPALPYPLFGVFTGQMSRQFAAAHKTEHHHS
jgi:hypothetical protein